MEIFWLATYYEILQKIVGDDKQICHQKEIILISFYFRSAQNDVTKTLIRENGNKSRLANPIYRIYPNFGDGMLLTKISPRRLSYDKDNTASVI